MKSAQGSTRRHAIAIISVLFVSLLVTMFVGAAIALVPMSLARSSADVSLRRADQAAKSGLDWVRGRISEDPAWNATAAKTFSGPGLYVSEGSGQVVGWVQQGAAWSRFRIRFNYQDGPASQASNSDAMNDPSSLWTDMPYVSSNNLPNSGQKTAPVARDSSGNYVSASPWSSAGLPVPSASLLLSVEGACGPVNFQGGQPSSFSGAVHTRTVQAVMKFGLNQSIKGAAIMSNGDLNITTNSPMTLKALSADAACIRTKGNLAMSGGVTSSNGELRFGGSSAVSPTLGSITLGSDGSGKLYQIPANKVRTPSAGAPTMPAGVYVVTNSGSVEYHAMNYAAYATATPPPAGVPATLPSSMTLTGPNSPPTPRWTVNLSSDLQITPAGAVTDFALVPDGGAAQSEAYGGVPAATPSPAAPPPTPPVPPLPAAAWTGYMWGQMPPYPAPNSNPAGYAAWKNFASKLGSGSTPSSFKGSGWTDYPLGGGVSLVLPNADIPGTPIHWMSWPITTPLSAVVSRLNTALAGYPADLAALRIAYPDPGTTPAPTPTPSPTPPAGGTPTLTTADLQLNLQAGGSGPLTVANDGNIVIGSQIQGNGAAITSKGNLYLIGTSTDLSSTPGGQLGLNLYAQGTIIVDCYQLKPSGATFYGLNLKGVAYAWQAVKLLLGNATSSADLNMTGVLEAYGGDPAGAATAGTGPITINAKSATVAFDPGYLANLQNSGPFVFDIVSWHEF